MSQDESLDQQVENRRNERLLLLASFKRDRRPTRTDLINLARFLLYGSAQGVNIGHLEKQRERVAKIIRLAVAEGDIREVPLARPGACCYVLVQEPMP